jgi:hypothetical protein
MACFYLFLTNLVSPVALLHGEVLFDQLNHSRLKIQHSVILEEWQ